MGTAVISPWFFYFINIVEGLDIAFWLFAVAGLLVGGMILVFLAIGEMDEDDFSPKTAKKIFIGGLIFMFLAILTPSQQTCVQMLIADNITYERLEMAGNTIEGIYQDILDLTETLIGDEE